MKIKRLFIWLLIFAPVLTVLRIIEQAVMIDPANGFYYDEMSMAGKLILAVTLAIMLVMLILGRTAKEYPKSAPVKSRPLFVASLVMAAAVVVDVFTTIVSEKFNIAVMGGSRGLLFYLYLLYIAAALASLLFFLYYAYTQYTGIKAARLAPIIPIFMAVLKLAIVFSEHAGMANISDNVNNVLMLCFLLIFWLLHGRVISNAGYSKAVKWIYGVGLCASVYCAVCTLPYYLITIFGRADLLHQTTLPSLLYLAAAVYIPVFLCSLLSGGTVTPKELDKMEIEEEAPSSDEEKQQEPSTADKIYEELSLGKRDNID